MSIQLTPAQQATLAHAHEHTKGKITWFPESIKGGARQKVIDGLSSRKLITAAGADWLISAEGYEALGVPLPAPVNQTSSEPGLEPTAKPLHRTRENSKQAHVIAMLKRPEGATIAQICEATGWQQHTVRGTFAGAFKKKLGLTIVSEKPDGKGRAYRVA